MKYNEFYNSFAGYYDEMTLFKKRIINEKSFFEKLMKKYGFKNSLDIGCGTGAHTVILSRLGIKSTGIDPSSGMIEKALQNSDDLKDIKFLNLSLQELSVSEESIYDSAFCMGNSISHITDKDELTEFISFLKKILLPGALFVFQILNYDKILSLRERIVNIRETEDKTFIRFYDFHENGFLDFNILTISGEKNRREHNIITTSLYAYSKKDIEELFSGAGFRVLEIFGDMELNQFDSNLSPNLIMILENNK